MQHGVLAVLVLAVLVAGVPVQIRYGSDIGLIAPDTTLGDTARGLFTVPMGGGAGVPHVGFFSNVEIAFIDAANQLLWAFNPDATLGGRVWDVSTWSDADLADPAFAPPPTWTLSGANASILAERLDWQFVKAAAGPYMLSVSLGSLHLDSWLNGVLNETAEFSVQAAALAAMPDQRSAFVVSENLAVWERPNMTLLEVSAGFTAVQPVRAVPMLGVAQDEYVSFLEVAPDGALIAGISSAGVQSWNISDYAAFGRVDVLDTAPGTSSNAAAGAEFACTRTGNASHVAFINVDDDGVRRVAVLGDDSRNLTLTRVIPTGALWFCAVAGGVGAANETLSVQTDGGIALYDLRSLRPDATPVHVEASRCPVLDYVGEVGSYMLYSHSRASPCNCANKTSKPCPLGLEVVGALGELGPFLVDGVHFLEALYTRPLGFDANVTLGVAMAAPQEACTPLTNAAAVDGNWCVVWRGSCPFNVKIVNCISAKAKGVLIVNEPGAELVYAATERFNLPVALVTNEVGVKIKEALAAASTPTGNPASPSVPPRVPVTDAASPLSVDLQLALISAVLLLVLG